MAAHIGDVEKKELYSIEQQTAMIIQPSHHLTHRFTIAYLRMA
jgi:hypothetical protein